MFRVAIEFPDRYAYHVATHLDTAMALVGAYKLSIPGDPDALSITVEKVSNGAVIFAWKPGGRRAA